MGSSFIKEKNLPKRLINIKDCPKGLFFKGNKRILQGGLLLSVVGPRRPTEYGKRVVKKLISELRGTGLVIVSGFMYGIDSYAHSAALENNLKTIAVLPYGINYDPPTYQKALYKEVISSGGCIVSEYKGDLSPKKWMFSDRNRIVAGLSKAVLIVEAEENSGTLITASYAKRFNRQIFTVPGQIFSQTSYGTNKLIQNGASLVTSSRNILSFYGLQVSNKNRKPIFNSNLEREIYDVVLTKPQNISNLVEILDFSPEEVGFTLTQMQLSGVLVEEKGVFSVG